jgi:hypothetical protein
MLLALLDIFQHCSDHWIMTAWMAWRTMEFSKR